MAIQVSYNPKNLQKLGKENLQLLSNFPRYWIASVS